MRKIASQVLIYQKTCKNVQKRASQMYFDPIQKHALSRSVHLEAVYLEALLYHPGAPDKKDVPAIRNTY